MPARMKPKKGIRYTADQKRMVLAYVKNHGQGGIREAVQEFGVSAPSIYLWMGMEKSGNKRKKKIKAKTESKLDGLRVRQIQTALVALHRLGKHLGNLQAIFKSLL